MKDNTRGITLIALAISIIVLLILAGITISMLSGENGILKQVANAKESTEDSKEQERIKIAVTSAQTETKYNITDKSVKKACDNEFGEGKTISKVFEDKAITILVKDTRREYYVDKNGEITISIAEPVNDTEGLNGEGTQEKPYKIESIEDLVEFSNNVNNGTTYSGKYIELTRDLDFRSFNSYRDYSVIVDEENNINLMTSLTSGQGFIPIGKETSLFKGVLMGNNKSIINLYENKDGIASLFGYVGSCTISDLILQKINITSKTMYASGIVASNYYGTINIENCNVNGKVTSEMSYASGVLAHTSVDSTSIITKCSIDVDVLSMNSKASGIFANLIKDTNAIIEDCVVNGNIVGKIASGAIVGEAGQAKCSIKNVSNYGKVIFTGEGANVSAGGLVGNIWSGSKGIIENSANYGEVEQTSTQSITGHSGIGGIIGVVHTSSFTVRNTFNTGKLTKKLSKFNTGGILGARGNNTTLNFIKSYYDNSKINTGIGNITDSLNIQGKSDEYLMSEDFVSELNKFIEDGKTVDLDTEEEVTIDTTGYAKWVYNKDGYATLDFTTKWNGTEWVNN